MATTLAPSSVAFSVAYIATFPEPEITTFLPEKEILLAFIISSVKYTNPYPVASVLVRLPP